MSVHRWAEEDGKFREISEHNPGLVVLLDSAGRVVAHQPVNRAVGLEILRLARLAGEMTEEGDEPGD